MNRGEVSDYLQSRFTSLRLVFTYDGVVVGVADGVVRPSETENWRRKRSHKLDGNRSRKNQNGEAAYLPS